MKDYIGEFKEYQIKHPVSVEYEPDSFIKEGVIQDPTKIEEKELKNLVTEAVINFMNSDNSKPSELLYEYKKDLIEKVKLYENRNGFLGMYFTDNEELNECSVGAIIDPTNRKNWVAMKQETFYKLPYCYKDDLRRFVNELRDLGKTENVGDEYLDQLRQQVKDANDKADSRYHEIYNDYLGMWAPSGDDPRAHTMFGQPSNEAHRMALQDGTYQLYKAEARKLENKLRTLEKRLKK